MQGYRIWSKGGSLFLGCELGEYPRIIFPQVLFRTLHNSDNFHKVIHIQKHHPYHTLAISMTRRTSGNPLLKYLRQLCNSFLFLYSKFLANRSYCYPNLVMVITQVHTKWVNDNKTGK